MTNGLVVMTPSSIAYSGTSASINADGSVDFSAVTFVKLNGIFTSDYDNYMMTVASNTSAGNTIWGWLTVSGANASPSSYVSQEINANGTALDSARRSDTTWIHTYFSPDRRNGATIYFFGPALAQPTAYRWVSSGGYQGAHIVDSSGTHGGSTVCDGFVLYPTGVATLTGKLTVFGFNQ